MENIKNEIKKLFFKLFNKKGLESTDFFDFSIWFMNKHDTRSQSSDYFQEILSETPSENDDIIKFILIKSFIRTRNKYFKIKVEDFVDEIVEIILNLNQENRRVDELIKQYDAYKTKNTIEQNLNYYHKFFKDNDKIKSQMVVSVESFEKITKGDFKFSLMISYINPVLVNSYDESLKEQILEFKLNQIVKSKDDFITINATSNKDYYFPEAEFYSYELNNKMNKFESGTNILYFYIKMENLSKNYEEIVISEKKPILDVFLANIKSLLNNFKQVKSLNTEIKIQNQFYDLNLKLNILVEFDPYTLSSIYSKFLNLLKDMISYKVLIEHKLKTILNYFDEISDQIEDHLNLDQKNKDSGCSIY